MNLQKGFRRITLIISIIYFLLVIVYVYFNSIHRVGYFDEDDVMTFIIVGPVAFVSIWIIYFILEYIIKWIIFGFIDNQKKGQEK